MKIFKSIATGFICALLFIATAHAEENALKGMKLGFGFDRGLGVTGSIGKLNGFVGNDGVSVDYILNRDVLNIEVDGSAFWYVAAGGYGDWDGDIGVRVPVGAELYFNEKVDAYAQIMPRLRVNHDAKFGLDFAIGVRYKF